MRKVEAIVREEMNRAGALELAMPVVQPAELWQESGRWQEYGPELLRFKDRHERDFVIQPTSEEVITDLARGELKTYRRLPAHFYQIQTKFRDERRPRFGIMRGREFVMKDGYSFHADYADLEREYRNMYDTYTRIFSRLGLRFRAVAADTGAIGGTGSHEFHVLADSGEDAIAFCPASDYAANVELAEALAPGARPAGREAMRKVPTPGKTKCEEVAELLGVALARTVKAIAVMHDKQFILVLVRGDHELNEIKTHKTIGAFRFATDAEIERALGCKAGYIGPLGVKVKVLADRAVAAMADFVCGANEEGYHLAGVNWGRDLGEPEKQLAHVGMNALAGRIEHRRQFIDDGGERRFAGAPLENLSRDRVGLEDALGRQQHPAALRLAVRQADAARQPRLGVVHYRISFGHRASMPQFALYSRVLYDT